MQEANFTEIWNDDVHDEEDGSTADGQMIPWQLRALLIFIFVWQFSFGVSNAGLLALLLFLQKLFQLLASNYNGGIIHEIYSGFPKTRNAALQLIGINTNAFIQYIVCPKCHAVFDYEFGFTKEGGNELPKQCPHVEMPNHPHVLQRKPCSAYLMQTFSKNMFTKV